ncbi:lectin-like protein [Clostridium sp. AF36-4]|uniref:lectin-like protein n=1 Tax=Clostridium sp. AF36-4 TaxID=2293015 RepID=UPI000E3EF3BF|nr:lectin-like protein [Clostridium sp. AF36-4]RGF54789.1 CHAP domain-containing protein [Clostridium sp. AF36-4]
MKKLRKMLIASLGAMLLFVAFVSVDKTEVQAATKEEGVSWAMSQIGKGLDYDGVKGNQCVDLIKYYYAHYGVAGYARGNAIQYTSNSLPPGWTRVYSNYQPGDIAVFKAKNGCSVCTTGENGHVGIITSIDSVGFNAVNQNYAGRSYCTQNWFHVRCLACAIRPNFTSDTTPPTISNVRITDVNADGYTVVCNVSDNVGISKVEFPSWNTDKHRGEDANWIQGSVSGNTASARISLSSLKSGAVQGNYVTHIYAWDSSGNKSGVPTSIVYIDRTAPTLTDIKVVEKDSKGYTVECKASDASGVDRVQFPTWTVKNDQDDIAKDWWTNQAVRGTRVSGDTYRFRVNISEHNNEVGSYVTHIYVYDKYGNYSCGRSGCVVPLGLFPQKIVKYGNSLLSLYNENYSWDEMKTLSGKLQSKLAEVEDAQKQQVITNLVSDQIRQYYYIGGSQAGKGQPWKWQSGSSVTYTNWDAAQPDCAGNSEFYMAAIRGHGRWNDMPSSYIYSGFILETPLNLKPAAEITYGNKVYRFYTAGIPYALAERYCKELGGNLVKIESEEKNNVIAQKVKELNKTFYIGASDEKAEGKFVWRDGSAVTYTNWSQNEPNNTADCGGENYVQMYANGKWNDYTGQSVDVGFIGEFDKMPTATSTPAPTNTPNATQKPQATNRPQSTKKPQATKKPSSQTDDSDYNWSSSDTSSDNVTVKKVTGVKVKKAAKKSLVVTWRWFVSQDGFEVQYALNKSFTKKKKTKRYDLYAERVKLRGLKRKKTYYVRVRAFKKVGTKKVYGKWSITKKCKVK